MLRKGFILYTALALSGFSFPGCRLLDGDYYCSGYNIEQLKLNQTVELEYGKVYCNPEYNIRISFDSIQDSRCPMDVICIWEGNGRAKIHLQESGKSSKFWLNTFDNFLTDTIINGLHFELMGILPYPHTDKDYQLEDYKVHLLISE